MTTRRWTSCWAVSSARAWTTSASAGTTPTRHPGCTGACIPRGTTGTCVSVFVRYSSEARSRTLFYRTDARALKQKYPHDERASRACRSARVRSSPNRSTTSSTPGQRSGARRRADRRGLRDRPGAGLAAGGGERFAFTRTQTGRRYAHCGDVTFTAVDKCSARDPHPWPRAGRVPSRTRW
jgi:hypothetical protein